jgi:hypothetical protein
MAGVGVFDRLCDSETACKTAGHRFGRLGQISYGALAL